MLGRLRLIAGSLSFWLVCKLGADCLREDSSFSFWLSRRASASLALPRTFVKFCSNSACYSKMRLNRLFFLLAISCGLCTLLFSRMNRLLLSLASLMIFL